MSDSNKDIRAAQLQFLQEAQAPRLENRNWSLSVELKGECQLFNCRATHLCWKIDAPSELRVCFTAHEINHGSVEVIFGDEEKSYWFRPFINRDGIVVWQEYGPTRLEPERLESENPFLTSEDLLSLIVDRAGTIMTQGSPNGGAAS